MDVLIFSRNQNRKQKSASQIRRLKDWSLDARNLKWKSNSRDHFDRIPIKKPNSVTIPTIKHHNKTRNNHILKENWIYHWERARERNDKWCTQRKERWVREGRQSLDSTLLSAGMIYRFSTGIGRSSTLKIYRSLWCMRGRSVFLL